MSETDLLAQRFPELGRQVPRTGLADLPTPLTSHRIKLPSGERRLLIKCDNLSSPLYGGNKVRKLEYLLAPPARRTVHRIATFGTVGSHHALATALFARREGFACTCFLAHQLKTPAAPRTLRLLLANDCEIVRFGGAYAKRIQTLRDHLRHRHVRVIPAGGSSWYGTLGFVNAGLELAAQIESSGLPVPERLYVASGTLGTAAGLALGLALAELPTSIQAIRVSHTDIANEDTLHRLISKTAAMMYRLDRSVPQDLQQRVNICLRHEFFAGGYAHSNAETDAALRFASQHLQLRLEATYTGKAMAALLSDAESPDLGQLLFWNTYNSAPLEDLTDAEPDSDRLPPEFLSYFS